MKTYEQILEEIIERGIAAATSSYANSPEKLKGSVEGFRACRGLQPPAIASLLRISREQTLQARNENLSNYWEIRCFEAEVEWVANCVSVLLRATVKPTIVSPTARAAILVSSIMGDPFLG